MRDFFNLLICPWFKCLLCLIFTDIYWVCLFRLRKVQHLLHYVLNKVPCHCLYIVAPCHVQSLCFTFMCVLSCTALSFLQLPPGWQRGYDENKSRYFYFNTFTGDSKWNFREVLVHCGLMDKVCVMWYNIHTLASCVLSVPATVFSNLTFTLPLRHVLFRIGSKFNLCV